MARSAKAFSSSVLGSPPREWGISPPPLAAPLLTGEMSQVSWFHLGAAEGCSSPPTPASTAPFLFSVCAPLLLEHLQLAEARLSVFLAHLSSHSGWGEAVLRPPASNLHNPRLTAGAHHPGFLPSVNPFRRSPEPRASLGSRRNRLQNAGARPRCLRAPPVSRPAPAAQTPARLALRAGRPLRCSSQALRAPTVRVPVRGPPQETRQPTAPPAPACAPGPRKPRSRGSQWFPAPSAG